MNDLEHPLPDLNDLPQGEWEEALRPLGNYDRRRALNRLRTREQFHEGKVILGTLQLEEAGQRGQLRAAAKRGAAPANPPLARPPEQAHWGRQVNVRLRRDDFEALCRAARLLDTSHTALARTFIINGSRQVLAEQARL